MHYHYNAMTQADLKKHITLLIRSRERNKYLVKYIRTCLQIPHDIANKG